MKMMYSGTKEAVKSALLGIAVNLNARRPRPEAEPPRAGATQRSPRSQATDHSECTSDEILAACTKI